MVHDCTEATDGYEPKCRAYSTRLGPRTMLPLFEVRCVRQSRRWQRCQVGQVLAQVLRQKRKGRGPTLVSDACNSSSKTTRELVPTNLRDSIQMASWSVSRLQLVSNIMVATSVANSQCNFAQKKSQDRHRTGFPQNEIPFLGILKKVLLNHAGQFIYSIIRIL
jgi:hypothetical protein